MMARVATRLAAGDPGFVRHRNGARTVCASALSALTLAVVTSLFDVAEPLQIMLFGAGVCFFAALLLTDPHRSECTCTFGLASVVAAAAIVVTVELSQTATSLAVAFLVLQMFLSYALRSCSLRAGNLAVVGALITFLVGSMQITSNRVQWFVLASSVGFAWITAAQYLILPDNPARSLIRSVDVFCRSVGEAVSAVVVDLTTGGDRRALHRCLNRIMLCRNAIDSQVAGALSPALGEHRAEELRVALYCAERGTEELIARARDPGWIDALPDDLARSITTNLQDLAHILRAGIDTHSLDSVADHAQCLQDRVEAEMLPAPVTIAAPDRATAVTAVTAMESARLIAQSLTQATTLVTAGPAPPVPVRCASTARTATASSTALPVQRTLAPTMALAIQAALGAVLSGLIAKVLGNEQSLLVAWTAYVVVAGSAEVSIRRAWTWLTATILGATAGVSIAAIVPDNLVWTFVVVATGVFFTIVTAAISYPAMVFWMNIALVPIIATEGRYLDLIRDKAVAAFIGGCVAAAVVLTVAPIRLSRDFRAAVLDYLDALDRALEAQQPGNEDRRATAGAALDRAHAALGAMMGSAFTTVHLFLQSPNPLTEQGVRIDAVHDAFLRLTPMLTESSRRLHGWTDRQAELTLGRLRDDVMEAKTAARGDVSPATSAARREVSLDQSDLLPLGANLHARLAEFAVLLRGRSRLRPGAN